MAEKHASDVDDRPSKRPHLDDANEDTESTPADATQQDQEQAVGITHFVSPGVPEFSCIIKQRYTDFLVNEILPNGRVLHITELPGSLRDRKRKRDHVANDVAADSTKHPEVEDEPSSVPDPPSGDHANGTTEQPEISAEEHATLQSIFGEETTFQILKLFHAVNAHRQRKPRDQPTVKSDVFSDKSKRTEAHVAIRQIFKSKLETATLQDEMGVITIKAAPTKSVQSARGQANINDNGARQKGKVGWDELGGEWLHFSLYKENKDTMEVLYFIAAQIKVPVRNFQFAGTKDRRGVTTQRIAVFRIRAEKIDSLQKGARGWVVGGFEYKKHGLDLGELTGNEFVLTLRQVRVEGAHGVETFSLTRNAVMQAAEAFKVNGFINYYGLQRFGSFSTGTHMVGRMMLQGDLEGAVNSILAYPHALVDPDTVLATAPQDDIDRARAIHAWRHTGRSNETVSKMPRRFQAEASIIQYLSKIGKKTGQMDQAQDWQGALMTIQRNLRLMYVHAYQSLVWNTVAGKRWEMYGGQVVVGDLVIVGEKDGDVGRGKKVEVDDQGEPVFHPAEHDQSASAEHAFTRARALSEAEVESGKYDIFDVVLPLPGFDVQYPANAIGKFYEEFMASEQGGKLDPHKMRRAWKDISLSGGYRKVIARPGEDLAVDVQEYEDENEQLVETDLERLKREAGVVQSGTGKTSAVKSDANGLHDEQNGADGATKHKKIAVVLKLQLGSSQYATMALRELTKGGAQNFKPEFSMTR